MPRGTGKDGSDTNVFHFGDHIQLVAAARSEERPSPEGEGFPKGISEAEVTERLSGSIGSFESTEILPEAFSPRR